MGRLDIGRKVDAAYPAERFTGSEADLLRRKVFPMPPAAELGIRPRCMEPGCTWPACKRTPPKKRSPACAMGHR